MRAEAASLVQKVWSYANVLKDDGLAFLEYTEQITYLLFIKMASERDASEQSELIPSRIGWKSLLQKQGKDLALHYSRVLMKLSEMSGLLGIIFAKPQSKINDPAKLALLIRLIDSETWFSLDVDVKGEIYEGLLARNAEDVRGGAGQYFTPRPVIKAVMETLRPKPTLTIADPACGTGGFLLGAYEFMRRTASKKELQFLRREALSGTDIVSNVVRLCAMNLFLHGLESSAQSVRALDSLASVPKKVDMVLTNPPFGQKSSVTAVGKNGKRQKERMEYDRPDFWATTSNKQLNFVQHVVTMLKKGGRAAVVVPDNVLFAAGAGEVVRRQLLKSCNVHTLLKLPTGIWYSPSVQANVLFFEYGRPTRETWIYDLRTNTNFSLRGKPLTDADMLEFIDCYQSYAPSKRKECERFRRFRVDEFLSRPKASMNITWLRPSSLRSDCLQDPDAIANEITTDLRLALTEFEMSQS